MTNTRTLLFTRTDRFDALCGRVRDTDPALWSAPSPCQGWTAADVVRHVVDTQLAFLAGRGLPVYAAALPPDPDWDPAAAFRRHSRHLAEIITDEVAAQPYVGYFGPTTVGDTLADFYGWDLVIHGWDLARATGLSYDVDDAEAKALDATADGWGAALHSQGVCGPELPTPVDATPFERLLARLGRDPRWTVTHHDRVSAHW